ncbi:GINS complex, Psf3 component [Neocallimastix lanati (nom. inval.)]|jgi:GINS complex subunit 3|uniref:DNA replication complex GINS protein PSF3 n=1 Tax=Neocallimastix californiae TaxID=1754190 RepID=A0A1Y2FB91_9FUNG|nr:GINS complex, Psf3 component [Neocallimastix sp. JGI-2020a]ORY81179.1 GINS complex, Psf3 component [Neocallimastix californiae]|eukprot:ORY81179.1 GINS complex, Psf3 component [Neocallimastix californiae]
MSINDEEYEEDYFDLDAILAEQQKMQASFIVDIPGLGFLENNPGEPLHKGEKVMLPYWIINELLNIVISNEDTEESIYILDLNYPRCFKNQFHNQLIAGPTSVNLYHSCPYYYHFGRNLLILAESKKISDILLMAYKARIPLIMDYSQQIQVTKDKAEFIRGLDEDERQLYKCGCESVISMKKWINREYGTLKLARSLNRSRLIL